MMNENSMKSFYPSIKRSILLLLTLPVAAPFLVDHRIGETALVRSNPRFVSKLTSPPSTAVSDYEKKTTDSAVEGTASGRESLQESVSLSSVIRPGLTSQPDLWKTFCPNVWEDASGPDVRMHWHKPASSESPGELSQKVATSLISQMADESAHSLSEMSRQEMQTSLSASIESFMVFCEKYLKSSLYDGYTARIVATRGSRATKCPAWHQDHVPVRWIQSLAGPGCQWVMLEDKGGEWDAADDSDKWTVATESVEQLNRRRVNPNLPIQQASPGEAVMLVGRSWNEFCKHEDFQNLSAVIHKSPSGLKPWEGRVLLTMDVLFPDEEDTEMAAAHI